MLSLPTGPWSISIFKELQGVESTTEDFTEHGLRLRDPFNSKGEGVGLIR